MKSVKNAFYSLCLLSGAMIFSGISGCDDKGQDIQNWVEVTNKLRVTAKQQGNVVPYRQPQFKALKAYFAEMNQMALVLTNDAKFRQRFNGAVARADLQATCAKVFLTKPEWKLMMERCTRNNFFLCSEEVRAYPDMALAMRGALTAEQVKRFDQAPSCRAAFVSK